MAGNSYDEERDADWGGLVGFALAIGVSGVGGLLGPERRRDLGEDTC